jgi:hypothetical protein
VLLCGNAAAVGTHLGSSQVAQPRKEAQERWRLETERDQALGRIAVVLLPDLIDALPIFCLNCLHAFRLQGIGTLLVGLHTICNS